MIYIRLYYHHYHYYYYQRVEANQNKTNNFLCAQITGNDHYHTR